VYLFKISGLFSCLSSFKQKSRIRAENPADGLAQKTYIHPRRETGCSATGADSQKKSEMT